MENNGLYQKFIELFKKGGGIHINPKNKGKFTASAKRAGMGVQEFAHHVLANKEKYSTTQIRRANFARNSKRFKHEEGGAVNPTHPTHNDPRLEDPTLFNAIFYEQRPGQLRAEYEKNKAHWDPNNTAQKIGVTPEEWMRMKLDGITNTTRKYNPNTESTKPSQNELPIKQHEHETTQQIMRKHGADLSSPKLTDPRYGGAAHWQSNVYTNPKEDPLVEVHEKSHLLNHANYGTMRKLGLKYPTNANASDYFYSVEELRARIKEMFFENKLDPKHTYTAQDIEKMKNDLNIKWAHVDDLDIPSEELAKWFNTVY